MAGRRDDPYGDPLDRGLAAAFGPGPASRGALATIAATVGPITGVLLRDTEAGPDGPLVKPASTEAPDSPGRYQLFGEIARGGMGAVLKGRDTDLGRDLAVKVLLEQHSGNPDLVRRFVEEAQIGGQLQHPGIVPVYELGTFPDRRPYFAMKLVKGRTLAALLDARGNPADDRARFLGIFGQVCQTVAYAHARGVIHRDLKPSNVMVGAFGEVQVMDWGLAKVLKEGGAADDGRPQASRTEASVIRTVRSGSEADASQAGSVLGTPAYMAPEQAAGDVDAVDERADVFGLGSILCEILTGRPAYTGRTGHEILRKAARGDTADALARLKDSGADPDLLSLAGTCMAAETSDRPREAGAVAARLTAHLDGVQERLRSSELARAGAQARAEEEAKRRRLTVALAASVLITVSLAGGGWAWIAAQRADRLAATGRQVDRALAEAADLRGQARAPAGQPVKWDQAIAAALHADSLLARGEGDRELRGRVRQALDGLTRERDAAKEVGAADARDRRLLERYADLYAVFCSTLNEARMEEDFRRAYVEYGLDLDTADPAEAGRRIAARPAAVEIAATLDQWIFMRRLRRPTDLAAVARLLAVVKVADPDPWRNRLRDVLGQHDRSALHKLVASADTDHLPLQSVLRLAWALRVSGDPAAAVALLVPLQRRHRDDYWVNQDLAQCLTEMRPARPAEALRFRTAAASLRPKSGHALERLGATLAMVGRHDDASEEYREAEQQAPGSAILHYDLGLNLRTAGKREEAIAQFREAARLDGDFAGPAFFALTDLLAETGRADEQIDLLRELIGRKPENPVAHSYLGQAMRRLGKPDEAVAELREAIRLGPDDANQHQILGEILSRQGKFDEAVAELREAIRLGRDDGVAPHHIGCILRARGKLDEAAAAFREAIRMDGSRVGAAPFDLAETLRDAGRTDEAVEVLRDVARSNPKDANVHERVGATLTKLGRLDEAAEVLRNVARLKPDDPAAHTHLGDALRGQGKLEEAAAAYREAVRLRPGDAPAHHGLGGLLFGQGRFDEALAELREAVRLEPASAQFRNSLGVILRATARPGDAISEFREAVRLDGPHIGRAPFNLAVTLRKVGRGDEAVDVLRGLARLKPEDASVRDRVGVALSDLGKQEEALAELREAIRLRPDHAPTHRNLGLVLMRLRKPDEALASFRRSRDLIPAGSPEIADFARDLSNAERQAALEKRLDAVVRGEDQVNGPAEGVAFALLCYGHESYAASARLFAEALQADPGLVDDRTVQNRYNAACAAALAGAGRGRDAPAGVRERERLRGQALDWLRGELAAWDRLLGGGPTPEAHARVRLALWHWKIDPDLAGIRDEPALAKLPGDESRACRALWVEVDALLRRASAEGTRK